MSPTKKTSAKLAEKARARWEENDRVIRRISDSLDVAQADLTKLGGSVGAGAGDLRRDLARLLRDARRHAASMGKATGKDLERLQRDIVTAAKPKSRASGKAKASAARKAKASAAAKPKARTAAKAKPRTTAKAKARPAAKAKAGTAAKAKARTPAKPKARAGARKPRAAGSRGRTSSATR
jgi:hypothetical protein